MSNDLEKNTALEVQPSEDQTSAKNLATLVYALQALSFFIGITIFAAIIINYIKMADVKGTWIQSHFRWQIRTFWFTLLWSILGGITVPIFIGYLILMGDFIWLIYRIAKGWLRLSNNRPMYSE